MTREEQQLEKHFRDLARTAYQRGIAVFSDFLNLNELNIFQSLRGEFSYLETETFGGYELAERQIAVFRPEAPVFYADYPVKCLKITPLNAKFAEDLNHRDYLGALLNLGVDRSKIGDILVGEKEAIFFCEEGIAPFLQQELTRVRHTPVLVEEAAPDEIQVTEHTEVVRGTVSTVRLDSVMSVALKASRSSLVSLIEEGKVFVNGRLVTSNGCQLKENDLISVRGNGRFRLLTLGGQTKKGRCVIEIEKYL